jgi:hypothetical protein
MEKGYALKNSRVDKKLALSRGKAKPGSQVKNWLSVGRGDFNEPSP